MHERKLAYSQVTNHLCWHTFRRSVLRYQGDRQSICASPFSSRHGFLAPSSINYYRIKKGHIVLLGKGMMNLLLLLNHQMSIACQRIELNICHNPHLHIVQG